MAANQPGNQELKGRISAVAVLDLRHMKSVDELSNISEIVAVGTILISNTFQGTLAGIPMTAVGSLRCPKVAKCTRSVAR